MSRCNVSNRLIGGRVSQCQAPLTFSHLTMEGTCYICLRQRGCARNSSSQQQLCLLLLPLFLGRNRNGSSTALAATWAVDCKCKGNWLPPPLWCTNKLKHNHTCKHTYHSFPLHSSSILKTITNLKTLVGLSFCSGSQRTADIFRPRSPYP